MYVARFTNSTVQFADDVGLHFYRSCKLAVIGQCVIITFRFLLWLAGSFGEFISDYSMYFFRTFGVYPVKARNLLVLRIGICKDTAIALTCL